MHLYSGPLSLFGRKVEIALREKGLPYACTMVPFSQTEGYAPKHPAVLAANPKGQVPVLIDGDLTLYESSVILAYLEDRHPEPPLYPRDARSRALCRLAELEAGEVLLRPVRKLMFRTEPPGPDAARREAQEQEAALAEPAIAENHRRLDARLQGRDFLCGAFSVADIATFLTVLYSLRNGGPGVGGHDNLGRWYETLAARPAFAGIMAEIADADRALSHPVERRES
jgi:glutathione S-transferase